MSGKNQSVDSYINQYDGQIKQRLKALRQLITNTLPEGAEETTAWGMPTYRVGGVNRVHFAAFKQHIGLFVGADVISQLGSKLDGYTTSKAVIHLPHDRPLPKSLVKAAVKASLRTNGIDSQPAKRKTQTMPEFVEREIKARGLEDAYAARPPYQRNDYLSWITSAKQDATKHRRLEQMLAELESGDKYMGMDYKSK